MITRSIVQQLLEDLLPAGSDTSCTAQLLHIHARNLLRAPDATEEQPHPSRLAHHEIWSTTQVLAKRVLKYCRTSKRGGAQGLV